MADVRNFGAVGDGQTDDTAAIRHAVEQGDGTVEFSTGTYLIRETIEIDLAQTGLRALVGAHGTACLRMQGPGPALRLVGTHEGTADPPTVSQSVWQRERMPTISGLEITGEHPQADGIELLRTMQTTIDGVLLRGLRHGIVLGERNRNFLLCHSHIYHNAGIGLFLDRCNLHQAIVSACHISYNRQAGIKSLGGDLHNLQVTGNDIEYNYADDIEDSADIWFDASAGTASEITIASNTIQARPSEGGTNIRVIGNQSPPPHAARLVAITGNVIGSQSTNIELAHVDRVAITGNTIYDGRSAAIRAIDCAHLVIGNNTFGWAHGVAREMNDGIYLERCWGANLTGLVLHETRQGNAEAGGAIELAECEDSAVHGCQILSAHWRGVVLRACRRCRVDSNSVIDRRESPSLLAGIEVRDSLGDNVVQNNLIRSAHETGIVMAGDDTATNNTRLR